MTLIAFDTSAAIPLLVASHEAHAPVAEELAGAEARLTGHSLAEVYSVLTRLPGDARLDRRDAVELIDANFGRALLLPADRAATLHQACARAGIAGGAVYDGLVALAALGHRAELWTRDARAAATYRALGASFRLLGDRVG